MVGRGGPHQEIVTVWVGLLGRGTVARCRRVFALTPGGARPDSSFSGPSGSSSSSSAGASSAPSRHSGLSGGIQFSPRAGARPLISGSSSSRRSVRCAGRAGGTGGGALLVQNQGTKFDLTGAPPDRSRRRLPCDRSRRLRLLQTMSSETALGLGARRDDDERPRHRHRPRAILSALPWSVPSAPSLRAEPPWHRGAGTRRGPRRTRSCPPTSTHGR